MSRLVATLAIAFLHATTLAGQEAWLGQTAARTGSLEVLAPQFRGGAGMPSSSVAMFGTLRWPIGAFERVVVEVAVAHASGAGGGNPYVPPFTLNAPPGTTLGDPYIGIETGGPEGMWVGEYGVRLPLATRYSAALAAGAYADVGRLGAFLGHGFSAWTHQGLRLRGASGLTARVRASVGVVFGRLPFASGGGLWLGYTAQAGYVRDGVSALAGFDGRIHNEFYDQFVLSFGVPLGRLRPGISVRLPLDAPLVTIKSASLGVSLGMDLGRGRR
jgi:hypothetical protein